MLCLGASFDTLGVELLGFWVARVIIQYQRNFKRQSLCGKVLPDFRDKASVETNQEKCSSCLGLLVTQSKDWQLVFIFFLQCSGVSSFVRAVLVINLTIFSRNTRVSLYLLALSPGAHFSSLLINVLCGILFFQNGHVGLH